MALLPRGDDLPLKRAQREVCRGVVEDLDLRPDPLVAAEQLRRAGTSIAALLGVNAPEEVLDALFGRFCLGK